MINRFYCKIFSRYTFVQIKIIEYKIIFYQKVDAAKHIHPTDLAAIFKKFKDNLGGQFPDDWFTWL